MREITEPRVTPEMCFAPAQETRSFGEVSMPDSGSAEINPRVHIHAERCRGKTEKRHRYACQTVTALWVSPYHTSTPASRLLASLAAQRQTCSIRHVRSLRKTTYPTLCSWVILRRPSCSTFKIQVVYSKETNENASEKCSETISATHAEFVRYRWPIILGPHSGLSSKEPFLAISSL